MFLDGVGLGPNDDTNPLALAPMPHVRSILGGGLVAGREIQEEGLLFRPLDACLGVEGLPQSATGQTALFTGVNAPAAVGMHVSAYPTAALRDLIMSHSLLKAGAGDGAAGNLRQRVFGPLLGVGEPTQLRHSATTPQRT